MADNSTRDHDDNHRDRARQPAPPESTGQVDGGMSPLGSAGYSTSLIGDARLNSRGNGPVKASVMRQAQQTYGNRAVQRVIQRHTTSEEAAVQRATNDPDATPEQGGGVVADAGGPASLSGSTVDITGGSVNINSPFTRANGVLQVDTIIATNVVGTNYTPGVGNLQ